jgi:hypothetical protein
MRVAALIISYLTRGSPVYMLSRASVNRMQRNQIFIFIGNHIFISLDPLQECVTNVAFQGQRLYIYIYI